MANKKNDDIVEEFNNDETLIKRTLMVAAYPALIKSELKEDGTFYKGFLPGFTSSVEDLESEDECVEYLQDILDDKVENLVFLGKSLPFVEEDEKLLKEYPDHKIVYLDINVYATKEELEYYDGCAGDCASCKHSCGDEEFYDDCYCEDCCDDGCDCCEDDDCDDDDCNCKHHHDEDDCDCHSHEHHHNCSCGEEHHHHGNDDDCCKNKHKNCDCKNDKDKKNK